MAGPGVALANTSRHLTLLTHLGAHIEALFVDTHCGLISIFTSRFTSLRRHHLSTHLDLRVEAVMSYHHSHRQLSVLTHLDLPVEAHCRSSYLR